MTADHGGEQPNFAAALGSDPGLVALRAERLAELAVFQGCTPEQLLAVAQRMRPLLATPGQVLMRQGERAASFIIIESGRAEVSHTGDDGVEALDEVSAGAIIGEIALLRDKPRTATVTAVDALAGYIGDDAAFAEIAELPEVSERLVTTARQRLAAYITPLPLVFGRPGDNACELMLRPVLPGDSERSSSAQVEFSTETLYRRFMSTRAPSPALMNYLFQVDYVDHFVWVLVDGADGPVVADVRYVRDVTDTDAAEIAFIVADGYQGRGIGSFLMDALIIAAHVGKVRRFTARMLADNLRMRTILDRFEPHWEREEPGVVTTEFDVPGLDTVRLDPVTTAEIAAAARQVMRAVG